MMLSLLSLPSFLGSALNFITPFVASALGFAGWYLSELWAGLKVMMANLSTWIVAGTIAAVASVLAVHTFTPDCPKQHINQSIPFTPSTDWNPFKNNGG